MSEPMVGRKMQTVGNAPMPAIMSIAASVSSIGSIPAMISPEQAPLPSFFAGTELCKILRVLEFVAEAEVVRPKVDQPVVLPEVAAGRQLDPDQRPDLRLRGLDIRRGPVEIAVGLIPGVEMHKRDA